MKTKFKITEEEKKRWAPFLDQTWQNIAPDVEPIIADQGPRARVASIIEITIGADCPQRFSNMTREENRVLGRLWVDRDRNTMKWLRETLNY